jgi:hypothetical protein
MLLLKIATAFFIVASFPLLAFLVAAAGGRLLRRTRKFGKRHYIPHKIDYFTEIVAIEIGKPRIVAGELILLGSGFLLFYWYLDTDDIFSATVILVMLSILPLAAMAVLFCGNQFLSRAMGCQFCVWIRWAVLLTVLWCAHAQTADQLGRVFGAGSLHLPLAYSAGTFLSALGLMSLATWSVLFLFQILMFVVVGAFNLRHRQKSTWLTPVLAAATTVSILLGSAIAGGAQAAVGLSELGKLIVVHLAYDYDMLNEQACTGKESDRKIVFLGEDQAHALAFSNPINNLKPDQQKKPFRLLKKEDVKARLPVFEGEVDCKYPRVE